VPKAVNAAVGVRHGVLFQTARFDPPMRRPRLRPVAIASSALKFPKQESYSMISPKSGKENYSEI